MRALKNFALGTLLVVTLLGFEAAPSQDAPWAEHLESAQKAFKEKRFDAGEKHLLAALAAVEGVGPQDPRYIPALESIASAYSNVGNWIGHESVVRRIVEAKTELLGPDHPDLASDLVMLAFLQRQLLKHTEAEEALKRAREIRESALGPNHTDTVYVRRELGHVYLARQKYTEAEEVFRGLLLLDEQGSEGNADMVAMDLEILAQTYRARGWLQDAERFSEEAKSIREQQFGPDDLRAAHKFWSVAENLFGRRKFADAEPFYLRWLEIEEKNSDSPNSNLVSCLTSLSLFYRAWGREPEAEQYFQRALQLQEQRVRGQQKGGSLSPALDWDVANLGNLYMKQGRFAEAEKLYRQLLENQGDERTSYDPSRNHFLVSLANSVCAQARLNDAEELFKEAQQLAERAMGERHPDTDFVLSARAKCYRRSGRHAAAEELYREMISRWEKADEFSFDATIALMNALGQYVEFLRETGRKEEAQAAQRRVNALARRLDQQNPSN